MRLINADRLKKEVSAMAIKNNYSAAKANALCKIIDNQPTVDAIYILRQRQQERELLEEIAKITSVEFAEKAAGVLDSKKHAYSFEAYLELLSRLRRLLLEEIPKDNALDMIQTCEQTDKLIEMWRYYKNERLQI